MDLANAERSERARQALAAYRVALGELEVEDESHLRDCITDLLHLAQGEGRPVATELRMALTNFIFEIEEVGVIVPPVLSDVLALLREPDTDFNTDF